jgi:hypothetical protein
MRLAPNRDWIIAIECSARGLVLYPYYSQYPVDRLSEDGPALCKQVQQMIDRRQASVRPGDPPYRPQIRFLVRPDGVSTYYRAYPLLESLKLPMKKQNVDRDEEIRPGSLGN